MYKKVPSHTISFYLPQNIQISNNSLFRPLKMNDPALYIKSNPFQVRDATQILGIFKKQISSDETDIILDIGCGPGDVTTGILKPVIGRFELLLGVDRSKSMVQYARQHCEDEDVLFEELDIAGDVTDFRDDWGTFTKIFSFYCLHWIKDIEKALSNIEYLMRKGGECLLVFVAQCPVFEMYEIMAKDDKWKTYMEDVNNFIPKTQNTAQPAFLFSQMLENAGITTINCATMNRSFAFPSTNMLQDCVVAVNPFIKRIPTQQRDEYIEECIRTLSAIRLEKGSANENEAYSFSYKLLVAHGLKN
ncbi:juvenile hormone acid O-methyltransferase [Parasteatoda tepidariorum]|uniref:juvenile hormone acid O-methyltransferase n=1 Tax=Parasteatoda tepidariorum TaxID=114398 RepID=UPI00077FB40B|nr:juvenile hormone acid O-methyltransferase [Parasteatoda tepidariorum]